MKRSVLALTVLASIATAQAPRVRDSAGVRIIENGPRLTAPVAFQVGEKPTFDVGGLQQNPIEELTERNPYPRLVRLASGNVVILDRTRVMFYNTAGKLIKAFGRQGQGPGEFDPATDVCATSGDTVLVGQGPRPVTRLTKDGELVSIFPLPEGAMTTERDGCFDDGTFVVMTRRPREQDQRSVYRFLRASPNGVLNTITDHKYPQFDMLVRAENPSAARGKRLYFASGDAFEIQAYDPSGKLAELIRTSDPLVPMTDADKAKLPLMAWRAGSSPAEIEDARRRAIAGSITKHFPTVGRMFVDLSGRIWLQDWSATENVTEPIGWTAFDSSGRLLGRLVLPGASKEQRRFVVHFGRDEVFVNRMDADGAIHYTAYPIHPVKR